MLPSILPDLVKECIILNNKKEDETTWSKIDTVFNKISNEINNKEQCVFVSQNCMNLLCRSIMSERSKLSGTSLIVLKKLVEYLKNEMPDLQNIINSLLKVCGRSNKVVYTRSINSFVHLCENIDILPFGKILVEYFISANKNVRLAVIKGIMVCKENYKFIKLIEKGKCDVNPEIRNICKSYNQVIEQNVVKEKNIVVDTFKLKLCKQEVITEIQNTLNYTHSPMKKHAKIENLTKSDTVNKISELEKHVRLLTGEYKSRVETNKVETKRVVDVKRLQKTKPAIERMPVKIKKDTGDDLTPKKLDRYLSKYRSIYGNSYKREEHNNYKVENSDVSDNDTTEESKVELKKELIEEHMEELKIKQMEESKVEMKEKTIVDQFEDPKVEQNQEINVETKIEQEKAENIIVENVQEPQNILLDQVQSTMEAIDSEDIINLQENINSRSVEEDQLPLVEKTIYEEDVNLYISSNQDITEKNISEIDLDMSKEMSNLSLVEIDNKYECAIEYSEKTECNTRTSAIDRDEACIIDETIAQQKSKQIQNKEYKKIENMEEINETGNHFINTLVSSPQKKCKEASLISNGSKESQNRFTALLFSDKEECVIYDINCESPVFKNKGDLSSSTDVRHVNAGSSFLYNNPIDINKSSGDFSKVESDVYIDLNVFKKVDE